ncbi:hypothetical protein LX77_03276 [Gelidibacter algens]|uniref:Glycerophosphoryl diester phosphodiesterase family protein n=1 Tax=Gelidibacter algens TaxID=49280 RepID=A0A1A7QWV1_9FLAO|nr:hypothetical protein [Gelidibacter algens]OBX23012.1 hypothetical protein A9996_16385 [Gelidibacter algens]RAJ19893.1 hypothetical protein LX77_03276 [Gelidibacter algens]
MTPTEFQSKIANARALDFGTIFNQSIELFKKSWLQGFLMQLFVVILMLPFIIILYVPLFMSLAAQSESGQVDPNAMNSFFAGLSIVYILMFIIGILVIGAIQVSLNAAFFRILRNLDEGREVKTSDLFYFMKGEYFGKILLLMLVTILISIPAALLFYLPLIYVMVPLSFFAIVFAFNPEWSIGDIVSSSFRLGNNKWMLTFGLLVVCYIIMMILTVMTCGLGSLFLAPFMFHPIYYIYKGTVGFEDLSELNQIGDSEVF